jgi:hypothetical protein
MLLLTSHIAEAGDALAMLENVPTSVVLDVLNPYNHRRELAWWAQADENAIDEHLSGNPTLGALARQRWNLCVATAADD